ncbi:hypothetical protein HX004_16025 [Myroides sp. 1354]|nr:hypothetical protein [Myroides sp. R163-1]MDM1057267.1 hypothetical protein [Myroides sp. 1354]MDM1070498.1 hypothetical protein [Myroides sp. 1372]
MGLTMGILAGLQSTYIQAQEVEVSILGGLSGVRQPSISLSNGSTLGVSASYLHEINQHLSLGVGLEVGTYQLTKEDADYKGTSPAIDGQGAAFEFRYEIAKFKEELKGTYFAIPIKMQYLGPNIGSEKLRLYAAAGIKYQIYSKVKSTQTLEGIRTSGYYEQWDAELHNPTYAGFGNLGDKTQESKLKLNSGFFVLGEIGVKYALSNNQALYLGFYGDCDLGAAGQANKSVLTYQEKEQINSVLPVENERYKLRMFTLGMKVKYSFGL